MDKIKNARFNLTWVDWNYCPVYCPPRAQTPYVKLLEDDLALYQNSTIDDNHSITCFLPGGAWDFSFELPKDTPGTDELELELPWLGGDTFHIKYADLVKYYAVPPVNLDQRKASDNKHQLFALPLLSVRDDGAESRMNVIMYVDMCFMRYYSTYEAVKASYNFMTPMEGRDYMHDVSSSNKVAAEWKQAEYIESKYFKTKTYKKTKFLSLEIQRKPQNKLQDTWLLSVYDGNEVDTDMLKEISTDKLNELLSLGYIRIRKSQLFSIKADKILLPLIAKRMLQARRDKEYFEGPVRRKIEYLNNRFKPQKGQAVDEYVMTFTLNVPKTAEHQAITKHPQIRYIYLPAEVQTYTYAQFESNYDQSKQAMQDLGRAAQEQEQRSMTQITEARDSLMAEQQAAEAAAEAAKAAALEADAAYKEDAGGGAAAADPDFRTPSAKKPLRMSGNVGPGPKMPRSPLVLQTRSRLAPGTPKKLWDIYRNSLPKKTELDEDRYYTVEDPPMHFTVHPIDALNPGSMHWRRDGTDDRWLAKVPRSIVPVEIGTFQYYDSKGRAGPVIPLKAAVQLVRERDALDSSLEDHVTYHTGRELLITYKELEKITEYCQLVHDHNPTDEDDEYQVRRVGMGTPTKGGAAAFDAEEFVQQAGSATPQKPRETLGGAGKFELKF